MIYSASYYSGIKQKHECTLLCRDPVRLASLVETFTYENGVGEVDANEVVKNLCDRLEAIDLATPFISKEYGRWVFAYYPDKKEQDES